MRACVRACARARARVCVCVCVDWMMVIMSANTLSRLVVITVKINKQIKKDEEEDWVSTKLLLFAFSRHFYFNPLSHISCLITI